jgi:NADH:ubiquinone oxidoreductase subunit F (NADH-binding)
VAEQAIWRVITNQELQELYKDSDIVADIKKESLKWTRHLDRMDHGRVVKNILESKLQGRGTKRPRLSGWKMMKRIYSKRRM